MLEVEGRIEKILGKLPSYEQAKKKIEALKKVKNLKILIWGLHVQKKSSAFALKRKPACCGD